MKNEKNEKIWNSIELPAELDTVILESVAKGSRRMQRKQAKVWKRTGAALAGAAAALMICVGVGYANPVAAQALAGVPGIGKVFAYLYDLEDYEGKYAQISEKAKPVEQPLNQEELESPEQNSGEKALEESEAASQEAQMLSTATDQGFTLSVQEYFCDGKSLYLSVKVESEKPFMEGIEGGSLQENQKGSMQLFVKNASLTGEDGTEIPLETPSWMLEGVYLDDSTFVGIARDSYEKLEMAGGILPDKFTYSVEIGHVKLYTEYGTPDARGKWELSLEVEADEEAEVIPVMEEAIGGIRIKEIQLQPYEVRVITESENGFTADGNWLIAFNEKGELLDDAFIGWGSVSFPREDGTEVHAFERPENLEKLYLFVVNEEKWLEEWKEHLYGPDDIWSGLEMVEFLKQNSPLQVETKIP